MTTMRLEDENNRPILEINNELPKDWHTDLSNLGKLVLYMQPDNDKMARIGILVLNKVIKDTLVLIDPNSGCFRSDSAITHIWELAELPVRVPDIRDILEKE